MSSSNDYPKTYSIGSYDDLDKRFYIEGRFNHVGINHYPDFSYSLIVDNHVSTPPKSIFTYGDVDIGDSGNDNLDNDYDLNMNVSGNLNINSNLLFNGDTNMDLLVSATKIKDKESDLEISFNTEFLVSDLSFSNLFNAFLEDSLITTSKPYVFITEDDSYSGSTSTISSFNSNGYTKTLSSSSRDILHIFFKFENSITSTTQLLNIGGRVSIQTDSTIQMNKFTPSTIDTSMNLSEYNMITFLRFKSITTSMHIFVNGDHITDVSCNSAPYTNNFIGGLSTDLFGSSTNTLSKGSFFHIRYHAPSSAITQSTYDSDYSSIVTNLNDSDYISPITEYSYTSRFITDDLYVDNNLGILTVPNSSYALTASGDIFTSGSFEQQGADFVFDRISDSYGRAFVHFNTGTQGKSTSYLYVNYKNDFNYGTQIGGSNAHVGVGKIPSTTYVLDVSGDVYNSSNIDVQGSGTSIVQGDLIVKDIDSIFGGTGSTVYNIETCTFFVRDDGITCGYGEGSVGLTANDGYGNANVSFNNYNGIADITGCNGRIECDVDDTDGTSYMYFEIKSGITQGTKNAPTLLMRLKRTSTESNVYFNGNANCTNIISRSDLNLKENISLLENPMEKIMNINGYNYMWKKDESRQITRMKSGVIAQEVEIIIPEVVYVQGNDDRHKSIDYSGLIAYLIESINELKLKLDETKTRYYELSKFYNSKS